MITFKQFINEEEYDSHLDENVLKLLSTKYSEAWESAAKDNSFLYRGISADFDTREFTKPYIRKAKADIFLSRLIHLLPSWKGFPSRLNNVHITNTDDGVIMDIIEPANMYAVFPKNDAVLAAIPVKDWNYDMEFMWKKLKLPSWGFYFFNEQILGGEGFSFSQIAKAEGENIGPIKERVEYLQKTIDKLKSENKSDEVILSSLFTGYPKEGNTEDRRQLKNALDLFMKLFNESGSVIKALDEIFNPYDAGIKLYTPKQISRIKKGVEVWFNGDALYINMSLVEDYLKAWAK